MRVGRYGRRERARRVSWAALSRQRRLYVCVCVVADPNSCGSVLYCSFFSSFSLSLSPDKRVRGLSLVISFEPLESTRFGAASFPLRLSQFRPVPFFYFIFSSPRREDMYISKSRIGFSLSLSLSFSSFRKRTPLHCTSLVTI
jgi:hypothetical protein